MNEKEFSHVISLGWFCSIALEIERIGLRDASYPFDWLLTQSFKDVLMLIENRFQDWLEYDDMWQYDIDPAHWYNKRFRISFFHDFKKSRRLKNQLDAVTEKYNRRIKRFFIAISEPTLFIRYIYNQKEADFISKNFKNIENSLKKYNRQNQIIYISNAEIETDFKTFAVK